MPKRMLQGTVVSDKQDKTVVVRSSAASPIRCMKKTVRRSKKYHAHDETNEYSRRRHRVDRGALADLEAQALGGRPGREETESHVSARSARRERKRCINDSDADQPRRGG